MAIQVKRGDYLTTEEASKYLNVTRFTVLNWIKSGKLQSASTFGGHARIPRGVLQAAVRQIKSTNHVPPPKNLEIRPFVHCYESKEILSLNCKHNCNKCLVFKKKIDLCFLAVREWGSLKIECKHDCLKCDYLANHHPQERKMLERLRLKEATKALAVPAQKNAVQGIIKKVFYNSGRLIGSIKKKL